MDMNALILAGGTLDEADPLFTQTTGGLRCLIDIHGQPMVQWVLNALNASQAVHEIFVIGLPETTLLYSQKPLHFLAESGGLFENIRSGVIAATQPEAPSSKVLLASGDLPGIRPEMVDWLSARVEQNPDVELYYNVITKETMNLGFPHANRTYVRFKDLTVCGGDMNVVDRKLFSQENPLWKKISEARKNPIKQVSLLGIDSLVLVALRLLTLEKAVTKVSKKLGVVGLALITPYAEMGMDADKPYQLEILRKTLEDKH